MRHGGTTTSLYTESGSSGGIRPDLGKFSKHSALPKTSLTRSLAAAGLSKAIYSAIASSSWRAGSVQITSAIYSFSLWPHFGYTFFPQVQHALPERAPQAAQADAA